MRFASLISTWECTTTRLLAGPSIILLRRSHRNYRGRRAIIRGTPTVARWSARSTTAQWSTVRPRNISSKNKVNQLAICFLCFV